MATKPLSSNNPSLKISAIYLAIILAVTFVVYTASLSNRFITNDDPGHLLNNILVRSLALESIGKMFQQTLNGTYIPLTTLSFAVEYHFFGLNPFVYHLTNTLLHLGVVALIFMIAVRWLKISVLAAAFGALLFGIHPMHVESVAWVTERKDVLYAMFYLLAVERYCAYVQTDRRSAYFLTLIFALLSILAKPMALSLPLILFVLDWYSRRKWSVILLLEKIPFFLLMIPVAWVTYTLNARVVGTAPLETVLTWIWSLMFYLQKFFVPDVLLTIYMLPKPVTILNFEFLKAIILFVAGGVLVWRYRRQRLLMFAVLYFFVSIFFLIRFDDKTDVNFVADRFMYLPSLGICLWLGVALEWAIHHFNRKVAIVLVLTGYLMVGGKTFAQTKLWGDGVLLWSAVIKKYPDCFYAYDHRGYALAQKGQFDQAITDYDYAVRLKPRYLPAYHNRALAYSKLGNDTKALDNFAETLAMDPAYVTGYFNRGIFYSQREDAEKAIADYTRAIELSGGLYGAAYSNRGAVYLSQKNVADAIKDFDRALAVDQRDIFARNNRAIASVIKGDNEAALKDLTEALRIDPKDAQTYLNRGLVYSRLKRDDLALADYQKALALDPRNKLALQKALELQNK